VSQALHGKLVAIVQQQGAQISAMRLLSRGINPIITQPFAIDDHDVGTSSSNAAMLLMALPMFLMMTCFMGGTYVAIDSTAGERERGTLEALFLSPVTSTTLVGVRCAAAALFGLIAIVVGIAGYAVVLRLLPFDDIGMNVELTKRSIAVMLMTSLPVLAFASVTQVLVGTYAKTFRAAQTLISLLMMLPMIPAMWVSMFPQQPSFPMMLVPTLSQSSLLMRALRGESTDIVFHVGAAGGTFAAAALLFAIAVKRFSPRHMLA
jgi:sodium transport system permease protein